MAQGRGQTPTHSLRAPVVPAPTRFGDWSSLFPEGSPGMVLTMLHAELTGRRAGHGVVWGPGASLCPQGHGPSPGQEPPPRAMSRHPEAVLGLSGNSGLSVAGRRAWPCFPQAGAPAPSSAVVALATRRKLAGPQVGAGRRGWTSGRRQHLRATRKGSSLEGLCPRSALGR